MLLILIISAWPMHLDPKNTIQNFQYLYANRVGAISKIAVVNQRSKDMKYLPKLDVNLIGNIVVALLVVKVLAKLLG